MTPWQRTFRVLTDNGVVSNRKELAELLKVHPSTITRRLEDKDGLISPADQLNLLDIAGKHGFKLPLETLVLGG